MEKYIDLVFLEPPGPHSTFIEAEDPSGRSISIGEWLKREDGYWVLRLPDFRAA
jgi:hypothetical protein